MKSVLNGNLEYERFENLESIQNLRRWEYKRLDETIWIRETEKFWRNERVSDRFGNDGGFRKQKVVQIEEFQIVEKVFRNGEFQIAKKIFEMKEF